MGVIGQALLTDYAAVSAICALLLGVALLTRKKRERELDMGEVLRMVAVWVAAVACLIAPAFQPAITQTQGMLLALLIAIAEIAAL